MADASKMLPHLKRWEGGYACVPGDKGGCTMTGVTIATFRKWYGASKTCEDLRRITDAQWLKIFKAGYWDRMKADYIVNQSLAELCVDMLWMSGQITAIKKIQRTLGCSVDGIVGPQTLSCLNRNPKQAYDTLWNMRYEWLYQIASRGSNRKFLQGWLNRLRSQRYAD